MRLRRNGPLVILDVFAVLAAYLGPLVLRFDGSVPDRYWQGFWSYLPVPVVLHLLSNYAFGLYGQMWRYASVQEARRVVLAGVTAGAAAIGGSAMVGAAAVPRSVIVAGATVAFMAFGAIRFQSRLFAFRRRSALAEHERVLLVGAGDACDLILKDIQRNTSLGLDPVGVVDDDPRKFGLFLHGIPVLGPTSSIVTLVKRHRIDQVLLVIPSATSEFVRQIASRCEEAEVPLRVLPTVRETVSGRVTARDIRDLSIEDLLGREQVAIDLEAVAALIGGRRVLVTGAGGSIGSEIARQVASFAPSELVMLDHDETHLHDAMMDLEGPGGIQAALVDIRDQERVVDVFMRYRPEIVFHAAAHKHVPLLEAHPQEAMRTNVLGTANLADAAAATGVKHFVLISTDKAIHPASIMGSSKWLAEQVVRGLHGNGTTFCAVRFGNVLGSRGSVIPTFFRQVARGGPVTVTDPEMVRYFMSVQEAVRLVLQAAALSSGGEVFTLDMGNPVRIIDLARKIIHLSGRVPGRDVDIKITGLRPGERLSEEILDPEEENIPSGHPGIVVSRPAIPDRAALRDAIRELERLARDGRLDDLGGRMKELAASRLQPAMVEVRL